MKKKLSTENKKINSLFITVIIIFIVLIFIASKLLIKNNNSDTKNNTVTEVSKTNSTLSGTNENTVQRENEVKDKESVLKLMTILSAEEKNEKTFENAFNIIKRENLDINAVDSEGKTVLMYAAFYDDKEIMLNIIKKGANVNAVDSSGRTALHWAAYYGKEDAVNILLKNKADKNIKDKLNLTAFDISEFEGHENISSVLSE